MTSEQSQISFALGGVFAMPETFDKKFCESMYNRARFFPFSPLTENQIVWLYRMLYKYRDQVPDTYNKYKSTVERYQFKKNETQ